MPDTNLSAEDERRLQEAFADFDPNAVSVADTISVGGTKDAFCQSWPTVKSVLSFLYNLPLIPERIKQAIGLVIKAGDTVIGAICPR